MLTTKQRSGPEITIRCISILLLLVCNWLSPVTSGASMLGFTGAPAATNSEFSRSGSAGIPAAGRSSKGESSGHSFVIERPQTSSSAELGIPPEFLLSKVTGTGVKLNLDELEIATSGGVLRYTPSKTTFEVGSARWDQKINSNEYILLFNNKPLLKIQRIPNTVEFTMRFEGGAYAEDIRLSKESGMASMVHLCKSDRVFSGQKEEAVQGCEADMNTVHLTMQEKIEYISKLILAIVNRVQFDQTSSTVQSSATSVDSILETMSLLSATVSRSSVQLQDLLRAWPLVDGSPAAISNVIDSSLVAAEQRIYSRIDDLRYRINETASEYATVSDSVLLFWDAIAEVNVSSAAAVQQISLALEDAEFELGFLNATSHTLSNKIVTLEETLNAKMINSIAELNNSMQLRHSELTEELSNKLQQLKNSSHHTSLLLEQSSIERNNANRIETLQLLTDLNQSISDVIGRPLQHDISSLREEINGNFSDFDDRWANDLLDATGLFIRRLELVNASSIEQKHALITLGTEVSAVQSNSESAIEEARSSVLATCTAAVENASLNSSSRDSQLADSIAAVNATLVSAYDSLAAAVVDAYIHTNESILRSEERLLAAVEVARNESLGQITALANESVQQSAQFSIELQRELVALNNSVESSIVNAGKTLLETISLARADFSRRHSDLFDFAADVNSSTTERFEVLQNELMRVNSSASEAAVSTNASLSQSMRLWAQQLQQQSETMRADFLASVDLLQQNITEVAAASDRSYDLLLDAVVAAESKLSTTLTTFNSSVEANRQTDAQLLSDFTAATAIEIATVREMIDANSESTTLALQLLSDAVNQNISTIDAQFESYLRASELAAAASLLALQEDTTAGFASVRADMNSSAMRASEAIDKFAADTALTFKEAKIANDEWSDALKTGLVDAMWNVSADVLALNTSLHLRINREVRDLRRESTQQQEQVNIRSSELAMQLEALQVDLLDAQLSSENLFANLDNRMRQTAAAEKNRTAEQQLQLSNSLNDVNASLWSSVQLSNASQWQKIQSIVAEHQARTAAVNQSIAAQLIAFEDLSLHLQQVERDAIDTQLQQTTALNNLQTEAARNFSVLQSAVERNLSKYLLVDDFKAQLSSLEMAIDERSDFNTRQFTTHFFEHNTSTVTALATFNASIRAALSEQDLLLDDLEDRLQLAHELQQKRFADASKNSSYLLQQVNSLQVDTHELLNSQQELAKQLSSSAEKQQQEMALFSQQLDARSVQLNEELRTEQQLLKTVVEKTAVDISSLEERVQTIITSDALFNKDINNIQISLTSQGDSIDLIKSQLSDVASVTASLHSNRDLFMMQQQAMAAAVSNISTAVLPSLFERCGGARATADAALQADSQLRDETNRFKEAVEKAQVQFAVKDAYLEARVEQLHHSITVDVSELRADYKQLEERSSTNLQQLSKSCEEADRRHSSSESSLSLLQRQVDAVQEAQRTAEAALSTQREKITSLELIAQQSRELQTEAAIEQRTRDQAATDLRNTVQSLGARLDAAESTIQRQQQEIALLEEENKKLLRDSATRESVDQLRNLLYELQASMVNHSGKVLDLLLQKNESP